MSSNATGNFLNKLRYTIYTPIYDLLVKSLFKKQRQISIEHLEIKENSKILLVGAGTGLDFEFLKNLNAEIHAGDITPSMVREMKKKAKKMDKSFIVSLMDGQKLDFPDETFDYIILHLIIAVIPNPIACIKEVERVLKTGGKVAVFDKFILPGKKPSLLRKIINPLTALLFSDITRDIDQIILNTKLRKTLDQSAAFGGNFRIVQLRKL